jgi:hypothetical protein
MLMRSENGHTFGVFNPPPGQYPPSSDLEPPYFYFSLDPQQHKHRTDTPVETILYEDGRCLIFGAAALEVEGG